MDKMRMESVDITDQNIEKIGALFPNVITESKDEDSNPIKAINFDLLKQELSKEVIDGDESYEFTWVGKKAAIVEANKPIRKTLRPCKEESVNWDTTENLYIEGDNLEVLKLLQESYLGKIKMIYIDPPYNTGNDFIYEDDFKVSREEYNEESGSVDENGERMIKNTDSNGRFHSDWCSMMYSRLMLSRNLHKDNGVIFISIDDNELDNLIKICDEIFGAENFISNIIWYKNNSKGNVKQISNVTEYIICYSKNKDIVSDFKINKKNAKEMCDVAKQFFDEENDIDSANSRFRKWMSEHNITGGEKKYNRIDEKGRLYTDKPLTAPGSKLYYDIIHPITGKSCKFASRRWAYKKDSFEELLRSGHILFGKDETTCPYLKYYLDENLSQRPTSHIQLTANNAVDMQLLGFLKQDFDYPKPVSLINSLLSFPAQEDNDIVLDFFSGSATTAHSVMKLNAENNTNRKFIMDQLPEKYDEKSETYKAGYKNICEIGKERIRRAAKKIHEESPDAKFDDGFRVLKVDESNMTDVYYSPDSYNQNMLQQLESNIKPDRTDLDLLFGCLLDWGLPLSMPYVSENIEGCTVHTYNDGDLIACFNANIPEKVIKEIAKRKPLRAVFRDSSFKGSPEKINLGETFKLLSPNTRVKII